MKSTVLINLMIAVLIGIALLITREPIVLAFLVLLHELPYGLEQTKMQIDAKLDGDDDDDSKPIGFTAAVG